MAEVVVLQHAAVEGLGAIEQVLLQQGIQARHVHTYAGDPVPRALDGAAGLIVMGGPMGVYQQQQYPFLRDELRLIERTIAGGRPVLGVCLGSQLIAAALGAEVAPGPRKEIGWYPVQTTPEAAADPIWAAMPEAFTAFHWHGDVFPLPSGAVPLASSELTPLQAFRYAGNVYGILFHLEVTRALIEAMVETFGDEIHDAGAGNSCHLPRLQTIGHGLFTRWAATLLTPPKPSS